MPDTSILVTLREDFTARCDAMRRAGSAFGKELDEIERRARAYDQGLDRLTKQHNRLSTDLVTAKKALSDAEKAFKKTDSEANKTNLQKARDEYERLKRELQETDAVTKNTQASMRDLNDELRKIENGSYQRRESGSMLSTLGKAGLTDMLASAAGELTGSVVSSALSPDTGSVITSALSGVASGASIGLLAGPVGALVGALVGGVSGLIEGATAVFEAHDDAFKARVSGLYEELTDSMEEHLSEGMSTAGSREQTRMAFTQRFGSEEAARDYLDEVEVLAQSTNYDYDSIVGYSKLLLNTYRPDEVFDVLMRLSDATAGLGLDNSDVTMFINGLSRMRTTGKVTQEYLNYFSERGVDVYQTLSDASGADKSQIADMVKGGEFSGSEAAQAILDYIGREYGGLSERLAETHDAMEDNLQDYKTSLDAAMGDTYNEADKERLQSEMDFYGGASGDALREVYGMIGSSEAAAAKHQSNLKTAALDWVLTGTRSEIIVDESTRDQLDALREEMQAAQEAYSAGDVSAGFRAESVLQAAEGLAENLYEVSDLARAQNDAEMDMITALQENTAALNAWRPDYDKGQELDKGMASTGGSSSSSQSTSGIAGAGSGPDWDRVDGWLGAESEEKRIDTTAAAKVYRFGNPSDQGMEDLEQYASMSPVLGYVYKQKGFAYGLQRVPYDDYPALLHEGERILTASEARYYDRVESETLLRAGERVLTTSEAKHSPDTSAVNVTVTGNTFNVRSDADIYDIGKSIADEILVRAALS